MSRAKKIENWPWQEGIPNKIYQNRDQWPKISIVVPSYNQGKFIEKTIRSVQLQNYPNLEFIIVDGGSTDNTVDVIRQYEDHLDFWVSEKDNGQAHAINKGLQSATGDILYWINSDDYLLPNALFHIGSFDWQPETGAVVGIGHKVDTHDRIQYTPEVPELSFQAFLRWVGYGNFMQPACFFSAKAWRECGPLNENLHFCLDVDLWLKISQKFKFEGIDQELAHAYIHPDAKTTAEKEKMKMETALLIAKYGPEGFEEGRKLLYCFTEKHLQYKKAYTLLFDNLFAKALRKLR
ncbi:glycosyltransferase family 2 protein [Tunicatimonas pelagia]|uniref:glycosyltransferase family 2 protein n=1 Tax=Tunicatimonas pelagia TaxID=931531 RepID=UPI002665E1B1|nr:glycosyltransferase family 2 protein [Tunicatimonas pelagia]WKN40711.1 glycosyltransferase family 2 protein [Tunicatimonas pelagia]